MKKSQLKKLIKENLSNSSKNIKITKEEINVVKDVLLNHMAHIKHDIIPKNKEDEEETQILTNEYNLLNSFLEKLL